MRWISAIAVRGPALAAIARAGIARAGIARAGIALAGIALAAPASALAAGGPAAPVQGGYGISAPGSSYRYVAVAAGHDTTVITRIGAGKRAGASSIRVAGAYGVPGVGSSGQTTGLAADGRTLVLAQLFGYPPPRATRLLILATPRLAVRARIVVPGWSIVDAISPDGRWLYFIHYPSYGDLSRYEVLAYDLVTRRMLPRPIVDPRDDDAKDAMVGFPVTRVMSADSRWAYTLYIRASGAPFIHALDTLGVRAKCVDLPSSLANIDIGNAQLSLGGGGARIRVDVDGTTQAVVDTRTLAVASTPAATLPPAASLAYTPTPVHLVTHREETRNTGGLPWWLLAVAATLAVVGSAMRLRARVRTD